MAVAQPAPAQRPHRRCGVRRARPAGLPGRHRHRRRRSTAARPRLRAAAGRPLLPPDPRPLELLRRPRVRPDRRRPAALRHDRPRRAEAAVIGRRRPARQTGRRASMIGTPTEGAPMPPTPLITPLEGRSPAVDEQAGVAPTAVLAGAVTLGAEASVWYGTVVRADTETISIGPRTNLQDGVVVHADPGVPVTVGAG